MKYISIVFWSLVVLLGVSFAILNSHTVAINYYAGELHIYLPLLLLIELALGAILGALATLPALLRAKRKYRRLKSRLKEHEQEIQNLRTIPIKDH